MVSVGIGQVARVAQGQGLVRADRGPAEALLRRLLGNQFAVDRLVDRRGDAQRRRQHANAGYLSESGARHDVLFQNRFPVDLRHDFGKGIQRGHAGGTRRSGA